MKSSRLPPRFSVEEPGYEAILSWDLPEHKMLCMNVGILCIHVGMVSATNAIDMLEILCNAVPLVYG